MPLRTLFTMYGFGCERHKDFRMPEPGEPMTAQDLMSMKERVAAARRRNGMN